MTRSFRTRLYSPKAASDLDTFGVLFIYRALMYFWGNGLVRAMGRLTTEESIVGVIDLVSFSLPAAYYARALYLFTFDLFGGPGMYVPDN